MSEDRECTCHPDEAPVPCRKKYAFTECENERLREENARLLAALKPFADKLQKQTGTGYTGDEYRAAAAAIREGKHD